MKFNTFKKLKPITIIFVKLFSLKSTYPLIILKSQKPYSVDTSEAGPGVVDVEVSCKGKGVPVGREKFTNKCR